MCRTHPYMPSTSAVLLQRTSQVRVTGLGPRAPVTPGVRNRRPSQNSGVHWSPFYRFLGGQANRWAFQERLERIRAVNVSLGAQGAQNRKPASGRRTRELGDLAIDSNSERLFTATQRRQGRLQATRRGRRTVRPSRPPALPAPQRPRPPWLGCGRSRRLTSPSGPGADPGWLLAVR